MKLKSAPKPLCGHNNALLPRHLGDPDIPVAQRIGDIAAMHRRDRHVVPTPTQSHGQILSVNLCAAHFIGGRKHDERVFKNVLIPKDVSTRAVQKQQPR